ncbi:hypothetical protein V6N13_076334 [Hibiscus sabdariffa]
MLSEQMGMGMLMLSYLVLGFLMLGGGEGCLEEERVALSLLKPFFPFLDYTFGIGGLDYYDAGEDYDSVEEKESSIDCCKWERVECNPTTGRLTHLFLNVTYMYWYDAASVEMSLLVVLSTKVLREGTINLLELNTLTNLKELYLDGNGIEGIESSIQEKGEMRLNKLEVFGLAGNKFTNTIFSSLAALPNLKSLDLGVNKLKGAIDVKDLNALSNLEELILSANEVTELVPSQELRSIDIIDGLKNLEGLRMSCHSDKDCNISLQSLNLFSSLKTLYLNGFNIEETRLHLHSQNKMDGLKNLEELDMQCYPDKDCNISLQSLNLFSSLKTLYLDGFNIKETRVHSRSQNKWQNLTNLEELVLWDSSLPFNFIGTLPSLKHLYMDGCYLDDSLFKRDTLEEFGNFARIRNIPRKQLFKKNWSNAFSKDSRPRRWWSEWHPT